MNQKFFINNVILNQIDLPFSGEFSDNVFRKCFFCEKQCNFSDSELKFTKNLAGFGKFYCNFCLKHNLYRKLNRNIFILSFRSLFGYLYFQNYLSQVQELNNKKILISEIEDYILTHEEIGNLNPLFLYNKESMIWFIDFSKIGTTKKKIPIEEILITIQNIIDSLCLEKLINGIVVSNLFKKYKDAILLFYTKRQRLNKILIPTLSNCGILDARTFSFDQTKNFVLKLTK